MYRKGIWEDAEEQYAQGQVLMPVADTSIFVDLMRRDPAALSRYADFEQQGISLVTTSITAME